MEDFRESIKWPKFLLKLDCEIKSSFLIHKNLQKIADFHWVIDKVYKKFASLWGIRRRTPINPYFFQFI